MRALTRAAGQLLGEAGRPATDATLDRVAATLRAAAADDEARSQLERGVLTREVEPTGFGTLLTGLPAPPRGAKPKARDARRRERERERARAQAAKAVARARERAEDLERKAAAAEEAAADARARATEAAAELEAAEQRLSEL